MAIANYKLSLTLKVEEVMRKLMKTFNAFMIMGLTAQTMASSIVCSSPRLKKALKISNTRVAFLEEGQLDGRQLASSAVKGVRTRNTAKGFDKIVHYEGHKHTIHIEDKSNLNELNDYIVIKSREGHEITYPLDCENI